MTLTLASIKAQAESVSLPAMPLGEIINNCVTNGDVITICDADGRCIACGLWFTDPVLDAVHDHADAPATLVKTGPNTVKVQLVEEAPCKT